MADIFVPETKPIPKEAKVPWWGWAFAGACAIIPLITLGGCLPVAIGFGGVAGCLSASRLKGKATWVRVTICAVIAGGCWVALVAFLLVVVMLQANLKGASQP